MSQLDDFLKMLDEEDYKRALKKEQTKQRVKKATAVPKKAKTPTVKSDVAKKTDELKEKRTYAEEVKKAKPETGDQAITRLTKEYKELMQNLYNAKGVPLFKPEQMRPGQQKLRDLEKQLSLAKKASSSQSSFQKTVDRDKAGEFAKFYTNLPSKEGKIDPRKALYMSRLSMKHYLKNR